MSEMETTEGVDRERIENFPLFCENVKIAQSKALKNRCKDFMEIMKKHQEIILVHFDMFENTAIHVATGSINPRLLEELIQMVPVADLERWQALCKKSSGGNTVLHEIVFRKRVLDMARVVFSFEDALHSRKMEEKRPLLELTNNQGETPLFMAAIVIGQHLHVAIWLISTTGFGNSWRNVQMFEEIDHMWKEKKENELAKYLAHIWVEKDLSWQDSPKEYN
ncbi:unnamed protein product [Sphenostylis stenocarpa]|uniref:Uncharacterized protein n=1 Tax=Sphenostylis stenocarpa TaxID=92480 RepID=A0AA86SGK7_9FABA|nr:unnamed protein product [Sphenostylis stenocarpa]